MGRIEKLIRTGDIVTFHTKKTLDRKLSFLEKVKGTKLDTVLSEVSYLAINIYGVVFLLKPEDGHTELLPFSHVSNEIKHIIRNWNFDEVIKEELIGEAITGMHVTSSYPNSVYSVISANKTGLQARLVLELYNILGVNVPIKIEEIGDIFSMHKTLDFNSGFYPVSLD